MAESIQYKLIQTGLNWLLLAGENATVSERLRHVMVALAEGVELILRARLRSFDWRQTLRHPESAGTGTEREWIAAACFRDECVGEPGLHGVAWRLVKLGLVKFSWNECGILQTLNDVRGRVRQYAFDVDQSLTASLVYTVSSFAERFLRKHFEEYCEEGLDGGLSMLRRYTSQSWRYVEEHVEAIRRNPLREAFSGNGEYRIACPICLQPALGCVEDGEETECAFCGYKAESECCARRWLDTFVPDFQWDVHQRPEIHECPYCQRRCCLPVGTILNRQPAYLCVSCGGEGDYHSCEHCGALLREGDGVRDDDDQELCDECLDIENEDDEEDGEIAAGNDEEDEQGDEEWDAVDDDDDIEDYEENERVANDEDDWGDNDDGPAIPKR